MDEEKNKERNEEELGFSVGYGKPPGETQFKPGRSGNPSGRPKRKAKTFAEALESELHTLIIANEGGKSQKMTKLDAIVKQQINKAAQGDPRATALVVKAIASLQLHTTDNLSPVLHALRAIQAKHEIANQKHTSTTAASDLSENLKNDQKDCNDPA